MNRPTPIHASPCKHCPSAHYEPDPEALEQREFMRDGKLTLAQAVFPCGWNPSALCRGVHDFMTEAMP